MKEPSYAFPAHWYGDPSNNVEHVTKLKVAAVKRNEQMRLNKSRRIKLLVKQVMKGRK